MNKFYVHQTLSASWGHLKGAKGAIWLSLLLLIAAEITALLLIVLFQLPVNFLLTPGTFAVIYSVLISLIFISALGPFITLPLQFAIKKVQGNPLSVDIATNCFRYWLKLLLTFLFIALINWVILFATVASILPLLLSSPLLHIIQINNDQVIFEQITWSPDVFQDLFFMLGMLFAGLTISSFVSLFLMFSLPLVVNEELNPMQAVWRSCKMIGKAWVRLCILFFFYLPLIWMAIQIPVWIGSLLGGVPAFIGWVCSIVLMIWFVPYCFIIYGASYKLLANH